MGKCRIIDGIEIVFNSLKTGRKVIHSKNKLILYYCPSYIFLCNLNGINASIFETKTFTIYLAPVA